MKSTRIWWEKVYTLGNFPDGRIKQDVYFEDDNHVEYIWTAEWATVIDLYANARRVERTNKPEGQWMKELDSIAKKAFEEIADFKIIEGTLLGLKEGELCLVVSDLSSLSDYESLIPISPRPSLQFLKSYYRKLLKCILVNNEIKEVEDVLGNLIYPESDMV